MQKGLLGALRVRANDGSTPPLAWFERRALGFDESPSTRASLSRAASRLHEMGLIERGLVPHRSKPSTNMHYRHARARIHPDDAREMWLQGERLHSVVRLAPTDADREDLEAALARWRDMSFRTQMFHKYSVWLFEPGDGVWPDDSAVIRLPPVAALDHVRQAISSHALP